MLSRKEIPLLLKKTFNTIKNASVNKYCLFNKIIDKSDANN